MKKTYNIIFITLAFVALILLIWQSRKEKPVEFFSEEICSDAKYFKFYQGGKTTCFPDNDVRNIQEIKDITELDLVCNMLQDLELDSWSPHRPSDYSICIIFERDGKNKCFIEMSRINGGYVFEFKGDLYRQDELANYLVDLFKIKYCNEINVDNSSTN